MRTLRNIISFVICITCCNNLLLANVDEMDSNSVRTTNYEEISRSNLDYSASVRELKEEIQYLKQHSDGQYSNYLTTVNTEIQYLSIIMTVLVTIIGVGGPLYINRESRKGMKDVSKKIEEYNEEIKSSRNLLRSLQFQVNKHEVYIKKIEKGYEKKRKLSLSIPIGKANKGLLEIVLNEKGCDASEKIKLLNELLKNDSKNIYALITRGVYHFELNDYFNSEKDFTKAIQLDPDEAISYNNMGVVYNEQGRYSEAIPFFDMAIEKDKKYALAYHNRAYSNRYLGNSIEAIKDCNRAINIEATFADAYNSLASIYREKEDFDNALKFIKISKGLDEENPWTYNGWAKLLIAQKKYEEAYGKSLKALMYDNRPELYDTCVEALMKMGNYEKAIVVCDKGLEQKPNMKIKKILEEKLEECQKQLFNQSLIDTYYE